jgi:acyl carrier protein
MKIENFKKLFEREIDKKINLEKDFSKNLLDSLDLISIVMVLEKELKIKIKEDKLSKVKNFNQLEIIVKKLLLKKK